jgi:hypothetical protein
MPSSLSSLSPLSNSPSTFLNIPQQRNMDIVSVNSGGKNVTKRIKNKRRNNKNKTNKKQNKRITRRNRYKV